jgi:hypothetical protein
LELDRVNCAIAPFQSRYGLNVSILDDTFFGTSGEHQVERSTDGVSFVQIGTVAANITTYSDTGLNAATAYAYRVRATSALSGDSGYSNPASATTAATVPGAPSTLNAVAVSSSRIDLSWTSNSITEDGFKIERSTDGVNFAQIGTVAANITTYSDTGLNAATAYAYRVRAYNSGGDSAYSNVASATTNVILPAPPGLQVISMRRQRRVRRST